MPEGLRRVALFQSDWPLQAQTVNLAHALAGAGMQVDVFLHDCTARVVDLEPGPRLAVHRVPSRLMDRIERRLRGVPGRLVAAALSGGPHDLYIGIEKRGLVWAGRLAGRTGVPLVYYSLELYDEAHPSAPDEIPGFRRLRALEKRYHAGCIATIVQDEARGQWLLRANGIARQPLILLPVSVAGAAIQRKTVALRERFSLPAEKPVLLYLGLLDEARGGIAIAGLGRAHGDEFSFVLHGYGRPENLRRIADAAAGRITLSTDLVPARNVPDLVASADIGLALYRTDCANDELTAFSSEKVALYCQAGVPFIARDTESYRRLRERFRCCELVAGIDGIPAAARAILADPAGYRAQAFAAFEAHYRAEAQVARVVGELGQLQQRRSGATASMTPITPAT